MARKTYNISSKARSGIRFKWRVKGFREVRQWDTTRAMLAARANRVMEAAGGVEKGYMVRSSTGKNRARAAVITSNAKAINHNRKHNALARNLTAGR